MPNAGERYAGSAKTDARPARDRLGGNGGDGLRNQQVIVDRSAPSLGQTATAVDDETLAGDEAGCLRGEEAHRLGDVLGSPHAADRHGG